MTMGSKLHQSQKDASERINMYLVSTVINNSGSLAKSITKGFTESITMNNFIFSHNLRPGKEFN